jgi:hypothetical protein
MTATFVVPKLFDREAPAKGRETCKRQPIYYNLITKGNNADIAS